MNLDRFLTTIPEGTCVQTTALGSNPKFYLAWKGYSLDKDDNIVFTGDWTENDPRWESMGIQVPSFLEWPFKVFGLHPIDFFQKVTDWDMTWSEWTHVDPENPKKTLEKRRIWVRKEKTRHFMVKNFSYAFRIEEVETALGIKVDLDFTVYVEGTNPRIALTRADDWFNKFEGQVRERAKDFVGAKDIFALMSQEPKAQHLRSLLHPLQTLEEDRRAKAKEKAPGTTAADLPSFGEYMSSMLIDMEGGGKKVPLPQVLGIKITGASFEEFNINAKEVKLLAAMSSTTVQAIENANIESKAASLRSADIKAAEGRAKATELDTAARLDRWTKLNSVIAGSPEATRLAIAEIQAAATVRTEELRTSAVQALATAASSKDNKLTTLVFPGSGVQPVVPVGGKEAA